MKIALENPREYTAEEVHEVLIRAMRRNESLLATLGEKFLAGVDPSTYPEHMRQQVEDARVIAWAVGVVWDGLASAEWRRAHEQ